MPCLPRLGSPSICSVVRALVFLRHAKADFQPQMPLSTVVQGLADVDLCAAVCGLADTIMDEAHPVSAILIRYVVYSKPLSRVHVDGIDELIHVVLVRW